MGYQALWCFGDSSCTVQVDILKKIHELEQGPVASYACCSVLKYSAKKEQLTIPLQSPGKLSTCYFTGININYDFFKHENKFATLSHYFPKLFFLEWAYLSFFVSFILIQTLFQVDTVKVIFPLVFQLLILFLGLEAWILLVSKANIPLQILHFTFPAQLELFSHLSYNLNTILFLLYFYLILTSSVRCSD